MNKQPTSRICMAGCFRLTEEYVSPAQKFRVLSVEAVERRDAESTRCSFCEKEQVWLRYIKHCVNKYSNWSSISHAKANKAESLILKVHHIQEEMKYREAADALEALLSAFEDNTVDSSMWRMGEKDGKED